MDDLDLIEREPATCRTCKVAFDAAICRSPFDPTRILARQQHCDRCVQAEQERAAKSYATWRSEEAVRITEEAWAKICPVEFRTPAEGGSHDQERFEADQAAAKEVLDHPLGPMGLILRGGTGAGKTRAIFRLLRRYHLMQPRPRIIALSSGQFDREARDAAGKFTLTEWFDRLAKADVLFVDDIGKGKWTPATAGQFWEVVDDRTKHHRPIFLTTNLNGDTLVQAIGIDRDIGEPLLRRLREHCRILTMKRNTSTP